MLFSPIHSLNSISSLVKIPCVLIRLGR
jgi:hypothetical protein